MAESGSHFGGMDMRLAILPVAICLSLWTIAGASVPTSWHFSYYKDRHPLRLQFDAVAIRSTPGHAGRPDLRPLGFEDESLKSWPVTDWYLVAVPPLARHDQGIEALVLQLSQRDDLAFASPVFLGFDGGPLMITEELLVGFQPGVSAAAAATILAGLPHLQVVAQDWAGMPGAYRLRSSLKNGFEVLAAANELALRPEVAYAEPNFIFTGRPGLFPNDPGFPSCWGLHNTGQFPGAVVDADMDAPEAWNITVGDAAILVVVIDTGVQQDHPDIHQVPGADFTTDGGDGGPVNVFDNHGTAVAGCVSAVINNALGTVGVAPGCRVASARPFIAINEFGNWTSQTSWTVNALDWAVSIGARVTNNSNSYGAPSAAITNKYNTTRNQGLVHFAAAGNSGGASISYPASAGPVNAVAALDVDGDLSFFSSFGFGLAFSAPGASIYSTDRTGTDGYFVGDYGFVNGTSFASPYAAGVAALVLSRNGAHTASQVEQILQQTAVDLGDPGYDTRFGHGFINAFQAVARDCNNNNIPDDQDIADGTSLDCNQNALPDECELDCNGNGIPDDCDIAEGAADCDGNEIPDECEDPSDCDANGVQDICDIAAGTLPDCNFNRIPDPCEVAAGTTPDCNANGVPDSCDVIGECGAPAGVCGGTGSCCTGSFSRGPGCRCSNCCQIICAFDPFCCTFAWDEICATEAQLEPGCFCSGTPPGVSADCNDNLIPDECEIASGTADCNGNLIPDDCDMGSGLSADCNRNLRPDECDLADGTSADCNENGRPDECDIGQGQAIASDHCAQAPLACPAGGVYVGNTSGATTDGSPSCGLSFLSPDVWYRYRPAADGVLTASLCGSFYDTVISVHSGCPGTEVNEVACNDDLCGLSSQVTLAVAAGTEYWIRVAGFLGSAGSFQLRLFGPDCLPDSLDCNDNGVPDECDIVDGIIADCDGNGVADSCEVRSVNYAATLGPVGHGVPWSMRLPAPPSAIGAVTFTFEASADLDGLFESIDPRFNGIQLSAIFTEPGARDCPPNPDVISRTLPDYQFNPAIAGRDGYLDLFPSPSVDPAACDGQSYVTVRVRYDASADCNGNGRLDACDIIAGVSFDCNGDGRPDECETDCNANGIPDVCEPDDDCNGNRVRDICDIAEGVSEDCDGNAVADECQADTDFDGVIDPCDPCPFDYPDDTDGDGVCDSDDACPNDPKKSVPGPCGCGVPDTDSDGDGVPDCLDLCPGADDGLFAPQCTGAIPATSSWGILILVLALAVAGKLNRRLRRSYPGGNHLDVTH